MVATYKIKMEIKKKLFLPIYENWIAYKKDKPSLGYSEYELFSDARITGENTTDFGPYQFINTVPYSQKKNRPQAYLILRIDNRLDYNYQLPELDKTDTSCYHGGNVVDEIAAVVSLAMGARIKAGSLIREFDSSGDKFGRPSKRESIIIPDIEPEYGRYKLLSVLGEHNITLLEPLKSLSALQENNVISLIKAARLYQQALWIAENDQSLSWIMLVSAIEIAANQWKREKEPPAERLKTASPQLYTLISTEAPSLVEKVAVVVNESLGATRKFVDFILEFLPSAPTKRPPKYVQHPWGKDEIKRTMEIIYSYRSNALHGGTPFPFPMCEVPYYPKDFEAPSEKPYGLGCYTYGGIWTIKDTPMLLNTFEYIVRNCLLSWWKALL